MKKTGAGGGDERSLRQPSPGSLPLRHDRAAPAGQAGREEQEVPERAHVASPKHVYELAHSRLLQGAIKRHRSGWKWTGIGGVWEGKGVGGKLLFLVKSRCYIPCFVLRARGGARGRGGDVMQALVGN